MKGSKDVKGSASKDVKGLASKDVKGSASKGVVGGGDGKRARDGADAEADPPAKRGRGRPRKSEAAPRETDEDAVEPDAVEFDAVEPDAVEFRRKTSAPDFSVPSAKPLASSSDDEPVAATLPSPKRGRGRPKRARVPPRANPDETTPTPNANSPDAFAFRDETGGAADVASSGPAVHAEATRRRASAAAAARRASALASGSGAGSVSEGFRRLRAVVAERQVPRDTLERHFARADAARDAGDATALVAAGAAVVHLFVRFRVRRRGGDDGDGAYRCGRVAAAAKDPNDPDAEWIVRVDGDGDGDATKVSRVSNVACGDDELETWTRRAHGGDADAAAASLEAATPRLASRKRAAANARVGERAG